MTYNAKETSTYEGNPLYLYRFLRGGTQYDYCSLAEDLTLAGTPSGTFTGSSLQHGKVGIGQPTRKDNLDIVFPLSDSFASLFLQRHTQFLPTSVTIWRGHLDDPDKEFEVIFKGKVRAGKPVDSSRIALSCTGLFSSTKIPGLGGYVHQSCRWALYHGGCQLTKASFETAGTVTALAGNVLTIAEAGAQADGYYSGGILEFGSAQALITDHTGTSITLRALPQILSHEMDYGGSASVTIAPGCDRSILTCRDKFNNVVNFGGFPYIPENDPWNDGSIV